MALIRGQLGQIGRFGPPRTWDGVLQVLPPGAALQL